MFFSVEAWGSASLRKVETLHRKAIKITYGLSNKTPNEIIYIETGSCELKAQIFKRQYKFWKTVKEDIEKDPSTEISIVLKTSNYILYDIMKICIKILDQRLNASNINYKSKFEVKIVTTHVVLLPAMLI